MPVRIKFSDKEMFKDIPYITHDDDADITINDPQKGKYNIAYYSSAEDMSEVWINTSAEKIELQQLGVEIPIFVMTKDEKLLPYCMKDRLVSIQDKINKGGK